MRALNFKRQVHPSTGVQLRPRRSTRNLMAQGEVSWRGGAGCARGRQISRRRGEDAGAPEPPTTHEGAFKHDVQGDAHDEHDR